SSCLPLEAERCECLGELAGDIGAVERKRHIGGEKADLAAAIIGLALIFHPGEGLGAQQRMHAVGELDFAARTPCVVAEQAEDFWLQDVAARNDEVRGSVGGLRLFHHAGMAKLSSRPSPRATMP